MICTTNMFSLIVSYIFFVAPVISLIECSCSAPTKSLAFSENATPTKTIEHIHMNSKLCA